MDKKRYAPLINVGAGLLAVGEAVGEFVIGDYEAAKDSGFAAMNHIFSGVVPYIFKGSSINRFSAEMNTAYGALRYLSVLTREKPSRSISYNAQPIVNMIGIGANASEAWLKEKDY